MTGSGPLGHHDGDLGAGLDGLPSRRVAADDVVLLDLVVVGLGLLPELQVGRPEGDLGLLDGELAELGHVVALGALADDRLHRAAAARRGARPRVGGHDLALGILLAEVRLVGLEGQVVGGQDGRRIGGGLAQDVGHRHPLGQDHRHHRDNAEQGQHPEPDGPTAPTGPAGRVRGGLVADLRGVRLVGRRQLAGGVRGWRGSRGGRGSRGWGLRGRGCGGALVDPVRGIEVRGSSLSGRAGRSRAGSHGTGSGTGTGGGTAAAGHDQRVGRRGRPGLCGGQLVLLDPHRGQERIGVPEALAGVPAGRALHEGVDPRRDLRPDGRRGGHVLVHVPVGHLHGRRGSERHLPGDQLEEQDPGAVDVGPGVGVVVLDLLGRQVGHGPEQQAVGLARVSALDGPGKAEVGDLDPTVLGDQHVLRLDVAVDVPGAVGCGQGLQHGVDDRQGLRGGQCPMGAQDIADGVPGNVLHDQVGHARIVALVVDRHRVGAVEAGCGARLALEPVHEPRVGGERRVHDLDGHRAVQPQVRTPVDRGHPAPGEEGLDPVAAVQDPAHQRVDRCGGRGRGRGHGAILGSGTGLAG